MGYCPGRGGERLEHVRVVDRLQRHSKAKYRNALMDMKIRDEFRRGVGPDDLDVCCGRANRDTSVTLIKKQLALNIRRGGVYDSRRWARWLLHNSTVDVGRVCRYSRLEW